MTPTQIKLALAGVMALIAWLLTTKKVDGKRVSRELEIDANVLSPTFGMTDEEIAAAAGARRNPALDPEMRRLIDLSNVLIDAEDD